MRLLLPQRRGNGAEKSPFGRRPKRETGSGVASVTMRCEKSESSSSNPNGQGEIGKRKPAAARRECSSTQVSVQRTDANPGAPGYLVKLNQTSVNSPTTRGMKKQ